MPLPGGRGLAWRVGDVVPEAGRPRPGARVAGRVPALGPRRRVPDRPAATRHGWCARRGQAGRRGRTSPASIDLSRWAEVISIGDRFHQALAGLTRPAVHRRTERPVGDRRSRRLGRIIDRSLPPASSRWHRLADVLRTRDRAEPARPRRPHRQRPVRRRASARGHRRLAVLAPAGLRERDRRRRCPRLGRRGRDAARGWWPTSIDSGSSSRGRCSTGSSPPSRAGFEATGRELEDRYRPAVDLAVDARAPSPDRHGRGLASLPYHAADARRPDRATSRATDPRRRRRREDRPPGADLPRARGVRGRDRGRRAGRARRHRDPPAGARRARPDAPRAGRAGRHPGRPPRRRGGRDADHRPVRAGLDHRPHRRPRGWRRRLPAQAVLAGRAGPAREVDPAPRDAGAAATLGPPRPARRRRSSATAT